MVLDSNKCNFICLKRNTQNETFFFINIGKKNRDEEKTLRMIIDNKIKFKSYVKNLCKKVSQKI